MKVRPYRRQVALLLQVIPEVAKETCFALNGGTAINFFLRNMPRLSVDIDLIYLPIEDRVTSLRNIAHALERIKQSVEVAIQGVKIIHQEDASKLQITFQGVQVKLEVNQTVRGTLQPPEEMSLCDKAQEEFDVFCAISVVSQGQLYGGKICAALDRQHPRDLFDVKYLLDGIGISQAVKKGLLLCLLSSKKPLHELIAPRFQDQRLAMANQFEGMSREPFDYAAYEHTRKKLMGAIDAAFSPEDKNFLLSIKQSEPDWGEHDFSGFPAVQWKLVNLKKLKMNNLEKHQAQYALLKEKLGE